jgi:hypothetical protein
MNEQNIIAALQNILVAGELAPPSAAQTIAADNYVNKLAAAIKETGRPYLVEITDVEIKGRGTLTIRHQVVGGNRSIISIKDSNGNDIDVDEHEVDSIRDQL